jgi:fructoselysine-6-P-deglycase FrlB-like protein
LDYPNDKKLSQKISKAKKETQEQGEKFKKLILRYRRLSTLGGGIKAPLPAEGEGHG